MKSWTQRERERWYCALVGTTAPPPSPPPLPAFLHAAAAAAAAAAVVVVIAAVVVVVAADGIGSPELVRSGVSMLLVVVMGDGGGGGGGGALGVAVSRNESGNPCILAHSRGVKKRYGTT